MREPIVLLIWIQPAPFNCSNRPALVEEIVFLLASPIDGDGVIENLCVPISACVVWKSDKQVNTDTDLDSKDVVCRSGELRIFSNVAAKAKYVNQVKIPREMLAHPVKRFFGDETIVVDVANNTRVAYSLGGETYCLNVRVPQF